MYIPRSGEKCATGVIGYASRGGLAYHHISYLPPTNIIDFSTTTRPIASNFGRSIASMPRRDEQELQGVADENPPAVEALRKKKTKPSIAEIRSEIEKPSAKYTPISYPPREAVAHVPEHCNTAIDYFRLYISTAHCDMIAKHTNMQTVVEIMKKTSV